MNLLFTAPYVRDPMAGGNLSGVAFNMVFVDPDKLTATANFYGIEDGPGPGLGRSRTITVSITGTETMAQLLAAFKTQIAALLGVTFQ